MNPRHSSQKHRKHTEHRYEIHFGQYDPEPDLPPLLWAYGMRLYAEVRACYDRLGCPFGPSDEALLVWFTFDPQAGTYYPPAGEPSDKHPIPSRN